MKNKKLYTVCYVDVGVKEFEAYITDMQLDDFKGGYVLEYTNLDGSIGYLNPQAIIFIEEEIE